MSMVRSTAMLVGDVNAGASTWREQLNKRSSDIERHAQEHLDAVVHSPIVSKREICGRRLDRERIYNPITCTFNSPNAMRPDVDMKPKGKKPNPESSTSIAGETPDWFTGERREYPSVTMTAFEQKTREQMRPSDGTATSHRMPTYFLGDHTQIKTSERIEIERAREEARKRTKAISASKVSSNPFEIDSSKHPKEGLYPFDYYSKPMHQSKMVTNKHPEFFQVNKHVPVREIDNASPTGKQFVLGKEGSVSGDLPPWMLEQAQRTQPPNEIKKVPVHKQSWHNGGGGGIKSIIETEYGQISDSTVSSDVPSFMFETSERVCPDDVRHLSEGQMNWYNGGYLSHGVRSQFDFNYGHISDSTVSGDGPNFLVSTNRRVCPEEVRMPKNKDMTWHNRDTVPRQLLPHETQNHYVVHSTVHTQQQKLREGKLENNTSTGMVHEADECAWHKRQTLKRQSYSTPNLETVRNTRSELISQRQKSIVSGREGSLQGPIAAVVKGPADSLQIQRLRKPSIYIPARDTKNEW